MNVYKVLAVALLTGLCWSCSSYFNQPVDFQNARIGETSEVTKRLKQLPPPKEKVVVGVYNFRDLTGQYKPSQVGSTFSTAVTQGATSILIKALDDSNWFTAIERENIGNLLNERNIIRSTRQEYQGNKSNEPQLPPLLYAGILLEGGIVSYDTNIMTGGMGARYLGVGGATQYRQDRVTIYLRAISTSSGKILKNIYVSKTILSQSLDASLFKYVSFQRLLEVETGFTRNEPVQIAVKEAIEKAVEGLVIEGIEDKLWYPKGGENAATGLIANYRAEKEEAELTGLYNRQTVNRNFENAIGLTLGATLISGDYSGEELAPAVGINYSRYFADAFSINLNSSVFELKNKSAFSERFISLNANGQFDILPRDEINPYVFAGGGVIAGLSNEDLPDDMSNTLFKLQYGLGLEYKLTNTLSLKGFAEHNIVLSDELDYVIGGKRDDHYFNFGVGINFYFGSNKKANNNIDN
ncbi:curli production assembly/transport component CsgG [Salegentibacter echinorum]|uniref:Curli production assembly/transport component CsgG n=1 Tax=Salegentibacter echinorum TaxID=1073325 RepID=A0A1M5LXZ1_SALEC|nr:CsgG/HfaB family protein [Salegentibacter echinorum]SHG69974.1 curli production assembly/transport component CsgG [Salegentibacter echinorum]